jgi:uncharacterized coiled-coil protein SlyX
MIYVLICLSLALAGVAGLQFFYMVYLERLNREQKTCIRKLERHIKYLNNRLQDAELQIVEKNAILDSFYEEYEIEEEEVWADVIEEN